MSNGTTATIRYVFTVIMPPRPMYSSDPLLQRAWLADTLARIETAVGPDRVGVTAVTEGEIRMEAGVDV